MSRGIIAIIVWLALVSSQAWARDNDDGIPWAKVGDWQVLVDTSVAGCFMAASYTQGEILRIGLDSLRKKGYMLIANQKWQSLEAGKEYKLQFQFDEESPWSGLFTAGKMGTLTVLTIAFSDGRFFQELAKKQALVIHYNDSLVARLPLSGSYAALKSVIQCQDRVNAIAAGNSDDPFADRDVSRPSDPFSNGSRLLDRGRFRDANDPFK